MKIITPEEIQQIVKEESEKARNESMTVECAIQKTIANSLIRILITNPAA